MIEKLEMNDDGDCKSKRELAAVARSDGGEFLTKYLDNATIYDPGKLSEAALH